LVAAARRRSKTAAASSQPAKLTPAEATRLADIISRGER
jgi:hypothetical protein